MVNLNRNLRLVNVGLGLWVVLSSLFLWDRWTAISLNGCITGVIVILSALLAMRAPVFRFVNAAAGVWLIASMFAWPIYSSPAVWNNAIAGAAIGLVSLVGPEHADMIAN
jgi:hypothetical protein